MIRLKRVYDHPEPDGSARFLVDRVWRRGVKKEALALDGWLKDVRLATSCGAGSATTREVGGVSAPVLCRADPQPETWQPIQLAARQRDVTLLYGAGRSTTTQCA